MKPLLFFVFFFIPFVSFTQTFEVNGERWVRIVFMEDDSTANLLNHCGDAMLVLQKGEELPNDFFYVKWVSANVKGIPCFTLTEKRTGRKAHCAHYAGHESRKAFKNAKERLWSTPIELLETKKFQIKFDFLIKF